MSMQVIEHIEVGSGGQAAIEFTSIPQTYTDLYILTSLRCDRATGSYDFYKIQLNGSNDISSGRWIEGDGSGAYSDSRIEVGVQTISLNTANTFNNGMHYIPNYTSSEYKSFSSDSVSENNSGTAGQILDAAIWNSTAAITSLKFISGVGDFVQYSSATLFGITAGSSGGVTVS